MKCYFYWFLLFVLLMPFACRAQFQIPEVPSLQTSVYDYANVLDATEKSNLEQKLLNYADTTSTQIVVVTVKDLKGESAEKVAPEWGHKWGVGQKDKDNGIFILVSIDDREMYIATGYGVQGKLPAGTVGDIIRRYMLPDFKVARYYYALDNGTDAIFAALNGTFKVEELSWWDNMGIGTALLILFGVYVILYFLAWLASMLPGNGHGGKGSSRKGGSSFSLGSGKSSRSGGFKGGFGGGGFSGGGAGGSW